MTLRQAPKTPFYYIVVGLVLTLCTPYPMYQASHGKKRATSVKQPRKGQPPPRSQGAGSQESAAPRNTDVWKTQDMLRVPASPVNKTDSENPVSRRVQWDTSSAGNSLLSTTSNRFIRVALVQNLKRALLSSAGRIEIRSSDMERIGTQGSLSFEISSFSGRIASDIPQRGKKELNLPCTLWSNNELNIIQFDGTSYRGSMILVSERRGYFSIVNYCDVEDYLRGVIPLEIGNCGKEDVEAIKAQAVAARTYTYKKIQDCKSRQAFDLLPDISDQVYGGVDAEKTICNQAIRETRDLVIVYPAQTNEGIKRDSLIFAYYHSTCGGRTANVEDVWEKPKFPYLRSIEDRDENGRPFCLGSWNYSWEESWSVERLSNIVSQYSREAFPQNPASGTIKDIVVDDRYACGRTKICRIKTTSGAFTYGGDKIRFVLRRNTGGFPVLRSAIISNVAKNGQTIVIRGKGYGHGIGMCQFGAIGRAHAGQNYEQIIKAYYTGVEIRSIGER